MACLYIRFVECTLYGLPFEIYFDQSVPGSNAVIFFSVPVERSYEKRRMVHINFKCEQSKVCPYANKGTDRSITQKTHRKLFNTALTSIQCGIYADLFHVNGSSHTFQNRYLILTKASAEDGSRYTRLSLIGQHGFQSKTETYCMAGMWLDEKKLCKHPNVNRKLFAAFCFHGKMFFCSDQRIIWRFLHLSVFKCYPIFTNVAPVISVYACSLLCITI